LECRKRPGDLKRSRIRHQKSRINACPTMKRPHQARVHRTPQPNLRANAFTPCEPE
jgi:hypothetical protein